MPDANETAFRTQSEEEFRAEVASLAAAHIQNETARDTFLALGHTALFAASISFTGQLAPLETMACKWALLLAWSANVIGLLGHTASFGAARKLIDARRTEIANVKTPDAFLADRLNDVALWTFPVALVSIFLFVVVNVSKADDQQEYSTTSSTSTSPDREGNNTSSKESKPEALDGSDAGATEPAPTSPTTAEQEIDD